MTSALTVIEGQRSKGALIFAPQNLDTPELYKAEATIIQARPDEFHNMKGKYMPNKSVCDRISEGAGIDFIAESCGVKTETRDDDLGKRTVFIGYAQGRVRLPDGSWRKSTLEEYEFDPKLRADIDAANKSDPERKRLYLDYAKIARQRASTGARLRVIRQLTGMPVTFTENETAKPLVFSRIVQNTDFILGTKEGRMMAIAAATGVAAQLYGQRQAPEALPNVIEDEPRNVTDSAEPEESAPFAETADPFAEKPSEDDLRMGYIMALEGYLEQDYLDATQKAFIKKAIADPEAPVEGPLSLHFLCDKCKDMEAKSRGKAS